CQFFFFSSRIRHTRFSRDWSSDVCSSDLRRASATRACSFATRAAAFFRLLEPFCLRDRSFCALRSRRSALRRNFGEAIFFPLERTAKWVSPRSIPTSCVVSGSGLSSTSTTNEAKYRPAESLITVTLDGVDGSSRDQRTRTSPILERYSLPF